MGDAADEETDLLWLSRDNDHLHSPAAGAGDEAKPLLFGSGPIPLEGEIKQEEENDVESQSQPNSNKYGSVPSNNKKNNDWAKETTSSSSKGSPAPSSKASKKKKKKKAAPPPPQSIFDESDGDDDNASSVFSEEDDSKTALTLGTKPHMPRRNWCLDFFRIVSVVTVVASMGLLATQLLPLFLAPLASQGYFDLALKVYVACFCFMFIFVECDAPLVGSSPLLQTYISRGFLYSFLGLICLQEAYSERVKEMIKTHSDEFHVAWASLFMQISSWLIFACGCFYMLMGVCCLKKLRDKLRKKDQAVWKRYRKELKEWKQLNAA